MLCKKCGGELEASARFCRFCGTKIQEDSTPAFAYISEPEKDATPNGNAASSTPVTQVHSYSKTEPEAHKPTPDTDESHFDIQEQSASQSEDKYSVFDDEEQASKFPDSPNDSDSYQSSSSSNGKGIAVWILCAVVSVILLCLIARDFQSRNSAKKYWESMNSQSYPDVTNDYEDFGAVGDSQSTDYADYPYDYGYDTGYDYSYEYSEEYQEEVSAKQPDEYQDYDEYDVYDEYNEYEEYQELVSSYNANQRIVIAGNGLRLRDAPNTKTGKKVGLIPNGTFINIEYIQDGWAYTTYKGVSGWCSCEFLYMPEDYEGKALFRAIVTNKDGIKLYKEATVYSDTVLSSIKYKSYVDVYKVQEDWWYVNYNGKYGWCKLKDLNDL